MSDKGNEEVLEKPDTDFFGRTLKFILEMTWAIFLAALKLAHFLLLFMGGWNCGLVWNF